MHSKRGFLFLAICMGIAAHAGGIFWLQHSSVSFAQKLYENAVSFRNDTSEVWERHQRTELLAEIFNQIPEKEREVKAELHELKTEYSPNFELTLPIITPFPLREAEFAFENRLFISVAGEEHENFQVTTSLVAPLTSPLGAPPLADFCFEDELFSDFDTLTGAQHFDIQVDYAPKRSRPGYVFRVTLLPHADVQFKRIRQNFYFLIDRSNSIPRTRYFFNKRAVAHSLDFLKKGDRFNILVFDDHVVRFREKVCEWTPESVTEAREFLEKQGHGGYFAVTELYASLGKIIPQDVAENEINSAILLSDGDTYLSQEKQRLTIGRWTAQNKGKVALYALASGTGNNLHLLELLSSFNKGAFFYAQDHQGVGDRLAFLMRTIQHPIGKQMVATAVCEDKSMTVFLQPKQARMPDLYQNRPFVIYGSTNKLSDFVLFLQGRYYDHRFDIKKRVSFKNAQLDAYTIERGWTQLVVQEFYEHYLADGNIAHLEAAKQLLMPLNLPMPLID